MWRILYPLRYFSLENSEKKSIDFIVTIIVALFVTMPFVFLPGTNFFHPNGFLDKLLVLTSALTGFYVAALVAAATFTHPDLDKTIRSGPIALVAKDSDGNKIRELLTRREFVCIIFGYLAFSTFALSVISSVLIGASSFDPNKIDFLVRTVPLINLAVYVVLRDIVLFLISVYVGHISVATSLGLYYLMDRLYRHDRKITTPKVPAHKKTDAA